MWRTKKQNGYTIVETMIVLAVTGVMLTTTVVLVSGQIERYRFKEISYNTQQALQDVINDVQTGYFSLGTDPTSCPQTGSNPAGSSNCIYVGKKIDILSTPSNRIVTTPLYMIGINSDPSTVANPDDIIPLNSYSTTTNLSQAFSLVPSGGVTFYIMFTRYQSLAPTVDFAGGSQSVVITEVKNSLTPLSTPAEICLDAGSRQAKLSVGGANYLSVKNEYVGAC